MKIKRFNESDDTYPRKAGDRNTDFFKNSKLEDFFKKENKFINIRENMLNLINEFISLDSNYFLEEYELQPGDVVDFSVGMINNNPDNRFALNIKTDNNYYYLRNIDFKELVEFIDNPELYRNQKKFNI